MSPIVEYNANLEWKNPENLEELGFVKNSLAFVGKGLADVETKDPTVNTAKVQIMDDEVELYVITSYKYGKAYSNSITVKITDIEVPDGVDAVSVDGAVKATFAHDFVQLSEAANVSVYSAAGAKVYAKQNVSSVNLAQLPASIYIICIEKGGKQNLYKYSVKR